jgi:hypothetical protein
MANPNKFEEMLERLINEDKAGAEELFHEIVVEKSRSIYENLLADEEVEEAEDHDEKDDDDEDMEEGSYDKKNKDDEDDDEMSEDFDLDEFEVEGGMNMMAQDEDPTDDPMAMGGDETDDLEMDVSMDDEGETDDEEGEVEDRVEDLEDALDELKAEFEKMMSGEEGEGEGEEDDAEMDMDDEGESEEDDDEMDMDDEGEEGEKEAFDPTDQVATMREYVEKVTAKMGDDGANKQSTVAGPNDMGGTAENIAQDDVENGVEANQGNLKGSALSDQNPKDMSTGNVNVPGGKASKSMKNQPKGHGAEKKGSGESGADAKSPIGSK